LCCLIMAVQMLLTYLEANEWEPRTAIEELREIENDARRCKKITQKLLDFSRSVPEERTLLDLTKVIEEALLLVQRQSEIENISFIKSYAENVPRVRGNSNSLQQVIINVVRNARDAMPAGGRITLLTAAEPWRDGTQCVRLSISDTGPGISPEIASSLFDPVVTTKGRGKGTGLGLAVSKRIVEEHDGHILFENRPGCGATFHILLPASDKASLERMDER
jgi:signal transduction histidine kinase